MVLVAWLLFTIIWYVVKRVARVTGVDEKVDQFLDTDGAGLSDEELVKHVGGFKHGSGGGWAALCGGMRRNWPVTKGRSTQASVVSIVEIGWTVQGNHG